MSRLVNAEWDTFSTSINIDRSSQSLLFPCEFDVLVVVVIYFGLFLFVRLPARFFWANPSTTPFVWCELPIIRGYC